MDSWKTLRNQYSACIQISSKALVEFFRFFVACHYIDFYRYLNGSKNLSVTLYYACLSDYILEHVTQFYSFRSLAKTISQNVRSTFKSCTCYIDEFHTQLKTGNSELESRELSKLFPQLVLHSFRMNIEFSPSLLFCT